MRVRAVEGGNGMSSECDRPLAHIGADKAPHFLEEHLQEVAFLAKGIDGLLNVGASPKVTAGDWIAGLCRK